MDILYLVDRIEAILHAGQKVPLSSKVIVDEQESMDVLDQMRVVIPEEIKTARRLNQDRERITQQAEAEASRIVAGADESALEVLKSLDSHMQRTMETVRRGISTLETSIQDSQVDSGQPG